MLSSLDLVGGFFIFLITFLESMLIFRSKKEGMTHRFYRFFYQSEEVAELHIKIGSVLGMAAGVIGLVVFVVFLIVKICS